MAEAPQGFGGAATTSIPQSDAAAPQSKETAPQSMVEAVLEAAAGGGGSDTETEHGEQKRKHKKAKQLLDAAASDAVAAEALASKLKLAQKQVGNLEGGPEGSSGAEDSKNGSKKQRHPKKSTV